MSSPGQSTSDTSYLEQFNQRMKRQKLAGDCETPRNSTTSYSNDDQITVRASRWRTQSEERMYSSKLLHALRRSRRETNTTMAKARQIRETADKVLAAAAKGTSKWSRAILAGKVVSKAKKVRRVKVTGVKRRKEAVGEGRRLPAVEKKVRVLSRLVPGCRKASFVNILEEASDYIAALEMQVKAMTAIAKIVAGGGGVSPVDPAS